MHKANLQNSLQRSLGFANHVSSKGPVIVGNNIWIGDTAILLSGANIGDGAVIGAGAVVTGALPPFCIAAGVPARVHGTRFPESIIAQMLEIKWWNWSPARIRRNRDFFDVDLTVDPDLDLFTLIKA